MANLRDIAKQANVSLGAVSRILSNDPTFKATDETRERVYKVANELNYVYKKQIKKDQYQVGLILALTSEKYSDPFFTSILSAAEEEGERIGIHISTIRNYNEIYSDDVLNSLLDLELDGFLLLENLPNEKLKLLKDKFKFIVGTNPASQDINVIDFNDFRATGEVIEHLINTGCRKIAYIGGGTPNQEFHSSDRMISYRESLRIHQIPYNPEWVFDCEWDLDICAECVHKLLNSDNRPDAIFAGSDTLASVILSELYKAGVKCPEDISVFGFNNLPISSHMIPPLSTVDVPTREIGILAVRRLKQLITGEDEQVLCTTLPARLIIRESTKEVIK